MIPKVGMYVKALQDIGFEHGDIEVKMGAVGEIVNVNYHNDQSHRQTLQVCEIIVGFTNSINVLANFGGDLPKGNTINFLKINYTIHHDCFKLFEGDSKTIKLLFES